ncbi:hypothetical protein VKT23_013536 [Stygiomarasmius scandens]|uniref:Mucoidy inhibitor A n=1 Tax=Marasmiellus scandens TaxID=2682957 RepID=A0ABR1J323_9AGAR
MSKDEQASLPPTFEPHNIELDSVDASKILNVSLYSGRAEITRSYKFAVNTGQNQVVINGLPFVMDRDSLRVQGRGEATIQDVNVSDVPRPPLAPNSTELDGLLDQKQRANKALDRCKKSLTSLETLFSTMHIQHVDVSQLGDIMDSYETTAERLDDKVTKLEKEIKELDERIREERAAVAPKNPRDTGIRASIGLFAENESDIELILIYAVSSAWWRAGYDIRVDMELKATPVTLIYKALVHQDTGESWENVPLTLETATPSYGFNLPTLHEWKLSMFKPLPLPPPPPPAPLLSAPGSAALRTRARGLVRRQSLNSSSVIEEEAEDASSDGLYVAYAPSMAQASASVSSKGNVSATFKVPGLVNIPSGTGERSFTIVELNLGAAMSWVAVPKEEAKVALKAKIQNSSEYTMLSGRASVYVDGSFISKIDVPPVNPNESFDCPLGLDPSVRISYLPLQKIVSTTGFYTKTTNYTYTQRIVVHNTKSVPINSLKVIDQIPISEDAQITVKLMNPSLKPPASAPPGSVPGTATSGMSPSSSTTASPVGSLTAHEGSKTTKRMSIISGPTINPNASPLPITPSYSKGQIPVGEGVIAQWDGSDDPTVDVEALGKNGKLNWLCEIPPLGTLNLSLQYEVNTPAKSTVIGL